MPTFAEKVYHIFNSDGQITQLQYAYEALNQSTQLVSVASSDFVVVANKKPTKAALQEEEEILVVQVGENIYMGVTGEPGDVLSFVKTAMELVSSKEYTLNCTLTPDIFTRSLADKLQKNIQTSAKRIPIVAAHIFGVEDNETKLYCTDLSAIEYRCYGIASGEDNSKMTAFLEKKYKADSDKNDLIVAAISSLLQSIGKEADHTELDVHVFSNEGKLERLSSQQIDKFLQNIAEMQ